MNAATRRMLTSLGGRALVAACLLLALFPAALPGGRSAVEVNVLIDESFSMPAGFAAQVQHQRQALCAALPSSSALRNIRFAANLVEETASTCPQQATPVALRSAALDGSATDIAAALQYVLQRLPGGQSAAVLLLSDGATTTGDALPALQQLRAAQVPVYLLTPPSAAIPDLVQLQDFRVPPRVAVGERVPVSVHLRGPVGEEVSVALALDGVDLQRQALVLESAAGQVVNFMYTPTHAGVHLLAATASRPGAAIDVPPLHGALNVLGPAPLLYVGRGVQESPLVVALRAAGRKVTAITAAEFSAHQAALSRARVVILDNIAIADMSAADWQRLTAAVRELGTGLLVLGGDSAFGAGAYRHSELEKILPVTAEGARADPPAAVLFLLDASGSMGRTGASASRFALGRQAVALTARQLLVGDLLGITTFADTVQVRRPLALAAAAADDVAVALDLDPGGGTRLLPALQSALQQLQQTQAEQLLLVLVTDGFAAEEDLEPASVALAEAGVTVIALAVGSEPNLATLRLLTQVNDGAVLPVTRDMTLPRLMSQEIARQRAPAWGPATTVVAVTPTDFFADPVAIWPGVSGYSVSKLRPSGRQYLQTEQGEPLLAMGFAGVGQVAVLPAGLGGAAAEWLRWPLFGRFFGGLLQTLESNAYAGLSLAVTERPGRLEFNVDQVALDSKQQTQQPELVLQDPQGRLAVVTLELLAPGRYRGVSDVSQQGLYRATLRQGHQTVRHAHYRNGGTELAAGGWLSRQQLREQQQWYHQQLVIPWSGASTLVASLPRQGAPWRGPLLVAAVLIYIVVIAVERGVPRLILRRRIWSRRQSAPANNKQASQSQ